MCAPFSDVVSRRAELTESLGHRQRRHLSGVIRTPQLRNHRPPIRCKPPAHRIRKTITRVGDLGQGAGQDRTVAAHRARVIERRRRRFALVAMRSGNNRTRIARIGMEPDHRQVRALMGSFRSRTRFVPA